MIEKIEFTIKGISPIIFDRWDSNGPEIKNSKDAQMYAIKKLYLNSKKELCIPAEAIKACMKRAAGELGKKTEAGRNRQSISSGLTFEDELLTTGYKEATGIKEERAVRQVGKKVTCVPMFRPFLKEWKVTAKANVFAMPVQFVKQALDLAGVRFGLLGHRPEFGRFIVTDFKEVKN